MHTQSLNLKSAGVDVDEKGFVKTDETMKTSNPKIYAAGDVVGRMPLVTVAAMEGVIAAENALEGSQSRKMDYPMIPRAIFTHPNVASVGCAQSFYKDVRRLSCCAE